MGLNGAIWERLGRATVHPTKILILERLAGMKEASPAELSVLLEIPLPSVSYHVRELKKMGFVWQTWERPVRGAIEHFYMLVDD